MSKQRTRKNNRPSKKKRLSKRGYDGTMYGPFRTRGGAQ